MVAIGFNEGINNRDLDALAGLMTDDHTFVDSVGGATTGKADCFDAWRRFFAACPDYRTVFAWLCCGRPRWPLEPGRRAASTGRGWESCSPARPGPAPSGRRRHSARWRSRWYAATWRWASRAGLAITAVLLLASAGWRLRVAAVLPVLLGAALAVAVMPHQNRYVINAIDTKAQELVFADSEPRVCVSQVHSGLLDEFIPRPGRH